MDDNVKMIAHNVVPLGTISASSTAGALAPAYLQIMEKSTIWRATGKDSEWVHVRWATPQEIDSVAAVFTNLTSAGQMRVRLTTEQAATNLASFSEQFDNAAWTKTAGIATTANFGVAPDGTATADRIVFSGANQFVSQVTGLAIGVKCSGAMWVKGVAGETICVAAGGVEQLFALDGNWQRLTVQNKTSVSNAVSISTSMGATARTVQAWGAQLETGTLSSSYYPTAGAAAQRPTGHMDAWQSYQYDSAFATACPGGGAELWQWGKTPIGVNGFAYGGGAHAAKYLPNVVNATGMAVTFQDPTNTMPAIEVAFIYAGKSWSPESRPDFGAALDPIDTTKNQRSEAGDLFSDVGVRARKQVLDLSILTPNDRKELWKILWNNGSSVPVWFDLYPNGSDPSLQQAHMMCAKLTVMGSMKSPIFRRYSNTLTLEEV